METGNNSKNLEQVPATRISAHSDGPHPGRPPLPNHSKVAAKEYEPRGWGMPPAIPSPNSRRLKISTGVGSNLNPAKTREKKQSVMRMPSATRRQSSIVVLTHGHGEPRKPMTKWKRGYVGFKREVKSSILVPLLLLLGVCGLATHVTGLAGMSLGYFRWTVECEGVVSVVDEGRASGVQTYNIGWARYEGMGSSQSSELGAALVANPTARGVSYVASQFDRRGIAGSSILEADWLSAVDRTSGAFGALTATGHFAGVAFNLVIVLLLLRLLLRTQFRQSKTCFVLMSKACAVLLLWLLSFGGVGFPLIVRETFTGQIISTLREEGFMCADNGKLSGEYAYIATGFACVAYTLMLFLTIWYGQAADKALLDRFHRKASVASLETETKAKRVSADMPKLSNNL